MAFQETRDLSASPKTSLDHHVHWVTLAQGSSPTVWATHPTHASPVPGSLSVDHAWHRDPRGLPSLGSEASNQSLYLNSLRTRKRKRPGGREQALSCSQPGSKSSQSHPSSKAELGWPAAGVPVLPLAACLTGKVILSPRISSVKWPHNHRAYIKGGPEAVGAITGPKTPEEQPEPHPLVPRTTPLGSETRAVMFWKPLREEPG